MSPILAVDLFPRTRQKSDINLSLSSHAEILVVLSQKKPDRHINIKLEFGDDKDSISAEELLKKAEKYKPKPKVTYKMMQAYIEEHYGFKVHTAYIAEVKRDLGLPIYDAPNAVEELKKPCNIQPNEWLRRLRKH